MGFSPVFPTLPFPIQRATEVEERSSVTDRLNRECTNAFFKTFTHVKLVFVVDMEHLRHHLKVITKSHRQLDVAPSMASNAQYFLKPRHTAGSAPLPAAVSTL